MKQYIKKQFDSGEKYVEAIPAGYPDWWDDFKTLVNDSLSLEALNINLMNFKAFGTIPRNINGQIVFNPLVYDFLVNNQENLETFNKGHKKGIKDFKKNYFKKYPNEAQAKTIFTLYNNQFKETILRGQGIYNDSNIMMLGFYNGILTGYWQFENNHLTEFKITENKKEATKSKLSLKQVALLYIYNGDHITAENNNEVAKKYGHNSGHRLQQYYNDYYKTVSRNSSGSARKDKSLANDIEKVIEHLPENKQEQAKKEAEKLKTIIQNKEHTDS